LECNINAAVTTTERAEEHGDSISIIHEGQWQEDESDIIIVSREIQWCRCEVGD
jgi:hypothetical protein